MTSGIFATTIPSTPIHTPRIVPLTVSNKSLVGTMASSSSSTTTPAASAEDIAKHGWTAVPVDANAILKGRSYVHKPRPRLVSDMPFPSDDPVVAKVQAYAKEHLVLQTYHHSMRVYYWGMLTTYVSIDRWRHLHYADKRRCLWLTGGRD